MIFFFFLQEFVLQSLKSLPIEEACCFVNTGIQKCCFPSEISAINGLWGGDNFVCLFNELHEPFSVTLYKFRGEICCLYKVSKQVVMQSILF